MNYITYSTLAGNRVEGVRSGSTGDAMISGAEGKALFIYNSLFNSRRTCGYSQTSRSTLSLGS
ncbi:hypothetical protein [Pseudomonas aeruginosa]|uniref:hypothetical protein n=1 Tax=Pseudomonas aeruginosa TaxID=287 RepID=UPI003D7698FD